MDRKQGLPSSVSRIFNGIKLNDEGVCEICIYMLYEVLQVSSFIHSQIAFTALFLFLPWLELYCSSKVDLDSGTCAIIDVPIQRIDTAGYIIFIGLIYMCYRLAFSQAIFKYRIYFIQSGWIHIDALSCLL